MMQITIIILSVLYVCGKTTGMRYGLELSPRSQLKWEPTYCDCDKLDVPIKQAVIHTSTIISKVTCRKNCTDCVLFDLCPEANALKNNKDAKTLRIFMEAFCGIDKLKGKPKICCTMLSTIASRNNEEIDDNVEEHPNSHLLPTDCGKLLTDRIIGGQIAEMYEYPWMALLSYTSVKDNGAEIFRFGCGGTIINSKYILTAAHCVKNKKLGGVRVGEYDISKRVDCQGKFESYVCESHIQDLKIEKAIIHEHYNATRGNITNDIALLRVKHSIDFNHRNVAPICLPTNTKKDHWKSSVGIQRATVAGWGFIQETVTANILRKVEVPVLNETTCFEYLYKKSKPDSSQSFKIICAGGEFEKDSCKGDSGGPLMIQSSYNDAIRVIQIGVVSYGPRICGSNIPAMYTDVTKYVDWILDHIEI